MGCSPVIDHSQIRSALSARIDGEPPGLPDDVVDAHLLGCQECRNFYEQALVMKDVLGRSQPHMPAQSPDLTELIVAGVEPEFRRQAARQALWSAVLRVIIAALGVCYLGWGIVMLAQSSSLIDVASGSGVTPPDPRLATYLIEAAAFRFALAAGLFFVAWLPRLVIGILPLVGSLWMFTFGFTVRFFIVGSATPGQAAHVVLLFITVVVLFASWLSNYGVNDLRSTWRKLSASPF